MKKVLIVDDNAEMRKLLNITLCSDYEIIEACNGEEAISMVQAHRPCAVLLDILLPGEVDGLEVLKVIKQDASGSPPLVAMVTARGTDTEFNKSSQFGADAYFLKPFSPMKIANWLHQKLP